MSLRPSKHPPDPKTVVADIAWFVCFIGTGVSLAVLWNTWCAPVLVAVFALQLAGLTELAHHGLHGNLYGRSRFWNRAFGGFASAVLGIDFIAYRDLHFEHHRNLATAHDPERDFYLNPSYAEAASGWKQRSGWSKLAAVPGVARGMANAMLSRLHSSAPQVHIVRWGVPLAIAAAGYVEGLRFLILVKVFVAWYLPLGLFVFIDFFLMQSEHYGIDANRRRRATGAEQYQVSWNVALPRFIGFLLMGRNLHAEHHEHPSQHWAAARDRKAGRTLTVGGQLRAWWLEGPRQFILPEVILPLESSSLPPTAQQEQLAAE